MIAAVFAFALALAAHHSVPAVYDINRTLTIRGVVTKTEWMNPHARFWVDAKNDEGTVSGWEMELPAPNALLREGVRRDFVAPGHPVTVNVFPAKNGSRLAHALVLTLPDGSVMNFPRNWLPMPENPK